MSIELREWQVRCKRAIGEYFLAAADIGTKPEPKIGACFGAGKSTMMAETAYSLTFGELAEICPVDFNVFVAPNRGIVGSHGGANTDAFGLIGSLLKFNFWPVERITVDRMAGLTVCPEIETTDSGLVIGAAAVFTYQYFSQRKVQETLLRWAEQGKRIALHYDEIHHVPEAFTAWAEALDRINAAAVCWTSWSGTWFRTDERVIVGRGDKSYHELTFCYPYEDGITDGIVRPVSFWIPDTTATSYDQVTGILIDERQVSEYLREIPAHIRKEMFDPDGWFVESMIRRAAQELAARRLKYPDAGCLVVCPPGFHGQEDLEDESLQDRVAEKIHRRLVELTGKPAALVLNGHPVSRIHDYRESDMEFLVAVNRISEGCDIPRLRCVLILRDLSGSQLLFEQIIGRVIRRRPEDDEEPALVIMPPIHALCEFARKVTVAQKRVTPKKLKPCPQCERIPCTCPCRRCGRKRPCKCPCPRCGQKPCVCKPVLFAFAELDGISDKHITHGTDIQDGFAVRADAIRKNVEACRHRDVAALGFILQCDAEVNGTACGENDDLPASIPPHVVANASNWVMLKEQVPVRVKQLARYFRQESNPYKAAWNHINRLFFQGTHWTAVCNPAQLSFEKLKEIHGYLDRAMKGGTL